ncbi:PREDICTED: chalcone synthase RJ5-like [Tarenaya hassleriana]|nr:PREDICTED: chalcone synthase RJ5-like [Tarenaya hassleriana]
MDRRTKVPGFIASAISCHLNDFLTKMLHDTGTDTIKDWNAVFWVMQATSKPVLDRIEAELQLHKDKLEVSRKVWREYGYMMSSSTLFVLNEVKKRMVEQRNEGSDYGVMVGFGAGLTLDAVVLQMVPLPPTLELAV